MHELSIALSLVERASQEAAKDRCRSVKSVTVVLGPLSGVARDSLEFAFTAASKGTLLQGAELRIEEIPMKVHCFSCGADSVADPTHFQCGTCSGTELRIIQGDEIQLRSMEVD